MEDWKIIKLPDYGPCEVESDLSLGLIDSYDSEYKYNSHKAFFTLVSKCLKEDIVDKLSIDDLNAIAEHYAHVLETIEEYREEYGKNKAPHEAFVAAYINSEFYRSIRTLTNTWMLSTTAFRKFQKNFEPPGLQIIRNFVIPQQGMIEVIQRSLPVFSLGFNFEAQNKLIANQLDIFKTYNFSHILPPTQLKTYDLFAGVADNIVELNNSFSSLAKKSPALEAPYLTDVDSFLSKSAHVVIDSNKFFREERRFREYLNDHPPEEDNFSDDYDNTKSSIQDGASGLILYGNETIENLKEVIGEEIDRNIREKFQPFESLLERLDLLTRKPRFIDILRKFGLSISRNHWKTYWKEPGKQFNPNPEYQAQTNLSLFLEGGFSTVAFVGREIASGNGFIDILVNFLGINYIVELKMIGANRGVGWAESGLSQLDKYMENFDVSESYLIVFDGRVTDRGRSLKDSYDMEHGRVHVIIVRIFFQD